MASLTSEGKPVETLDFAQLYVIGDKTEAYLFDKRYVRVWALEPHLVDLVQRVLDVGRQDLDAASGPLRDILSAWSSQPSQFPSGFAALESELEQESEGDPHDRRVLPNLAINVANDCNLSCTYCYANKGLYDAPRGLLHPDDAREFARRFIDEFDLISGVQFMGGEPSMNAPTMRAVAEEFDAAALDGRVSDTPTYRIVTNGVTFTPDFLDVCERYGFELTVSLDGPKCVHDAARPRVSGYGSYDAVRRNIDRGIARGLTIGFEPTFSMAHLRAGYSLIDTCRWFADEFGVRVLHAPPVSKNRYLEDDGLGLSVQDKVEQYCAASEWGVVNLLSRGELLMHDYTLRILVGLSKREINEYICPAGNSQISVSTSGELSPCWMFTDEQAVSMGSVWNDGAIADQVQPVLRKLEALELRTHPVCRACVMQPVCFGCKGGDFHEGNALEAKPNCDYMRAMLATVISTVLCRHDGAISPDGSGSSGRTLGERVWEHLRPVVSSDLPGPRGQKAQRTPVLLGMPRMPT